MRRQRRTGHELEWFQRHHPDSQHHQLQLRRRRNAREQYGFRRPGRVKRCDHPGHGQVRWLHHRGAGGSQARQEDYGADEVALAKDGRQVLVGAIPANKRASQLKKLRELCTTGAKEMGGSAISAKPRLIDGAKAEGCLLEVPQGDNGRAKGRGALLHGPAQWHRLRGDGCSQPVW